MARRAQLLVFLGVLGSAFSPIAAGALPIDSASFNRRASAEVGAVSSTNPPVGALPGLVPHRAEILDRPLLEPRCERAESQRQLIRVPAGRFGLDGWLLHPLAPDPTLLLHGDSSVSGCVADSGPVCGPAVALATLSSSVLLTLPNGDARRGGRHQIRTSKKVRASGRTGRTRRERTGRRFALLKIRDQYR